MCVIIQNGMWIIYTAVLGPHHSVLSLIFFKIPKQTTIFFINYKTEIIATAPIHNYLQQVEKTKCVINAKWFLHERNTTVIGSAEIALILTSGSRDVHPRKRNDLYTCECNKEMQFAVEAQRVQDYLVIISVCFCACLPSALLLLLLRHVLYAMLLVVKTKKRFLRLLITCGTYFRIALTHNLF